MRNFHPGLPRRARWLALLTLGIALPLPYAAAAPAVHTADVVIYGGTSAGLAAAVQATRLGRSVIVVSPDRHLGGLTSGGLGWTDSGNKAAIGGLARSFYKEVGSRYGSTNAAWTFEPHVAEAVFEQWVAEHRLVVHRDAWLDRAGGVVKEGARVRALRTLDGTEYRGRVFLDCTYEGDLLAAAGVSFHVGREANAEFGETLNGIQVARAVSHQFDRPVDPYVTPGDPASGLLYGVRPGPPPGPDGAADQRLQAYNFRVCMSDVPTNRVPFPKPDGYDPKHYELLARLLDAGWRAVWNKFDRIPNGKTDTNNHGPFSTDFIGMNYDYPEADYARRDALRAEHRRYQQGLFWFLANDPRCPADVRERMAKWGLARDEFADNGHWPYQLYVREARRMRSDFVITEGHLRRQRPTPRPVGMGSYNMDSHNVQRYVDAQGHARNEGDIQVNPGGPYPVDYGALVPKRGECDNLLVPVCVSCTHISYGSIRMEPVFMILGQSAATAAALAVAEDLAVQDVDYARLRERLLADGQVLELAAGGKSGKP